MVRDILQLNNNEKRIIVGVLIGILGMVFLYGLFVKQTISYVVERRTLDKEVGLLASDISELEARYLERGEAVTLVRAYELGFTEATNELYISRNSFAQLSRNDTQNE